MGFGVNIAPLNPHNNQHSATQIAGYGVLGAAIGGVAGAGGYSLYRKLSNEPKITVNELEVPPDSIAERAAKAERNAKLEEIGNWKREIDAKLDFDKMPNFIPENASPTRDERKAELRAAGARDRFVEMPKYVPPEFHVRV